MLKFREESSLRNFNITHLRMKQVGNVEIPQTAFLAVLQVD